MKKLAGALVLEELVRFLTGPAVGLVEERRRKNSSFTAIKTKDIYF